MLFLLLPIVAHSLISLMVKLLNIFWRKKKTFIKPFRIFRAFPSILQKYRHWVYSVPDKFIVKFGKGLYLRLLYWLSPKSIHFQLS